MPGDLGSLGLGDMGAWMTEPDEITDRDVADIAALAGCAVGFVIAVIITLIGAAVWMWSV